MKFSISRSKQKLNLIQNCLSCIQILGSLPMNKLSIQPTLMFKKII